MQEDSSTPIEAIDPASLHKRPPGAPAGHAWPTRNLLVGLAFIVLAGCMVLVFLVLPEFVGEKPVPPPAESEPARTLPRPAKPMPQVATKSEPTSPDAPTLSEQELHALRLEAESLLLEVIEKQEALRQQGVRLWAAGEFDRAAANGQAGDEALRTLAYAEAIRQYAQAVHTLQQLERQVGPVLAEQLSLGEQALGRNQGETALRHFELAKAIDPNNRQAKDGLKRARTIQELFSILETGGNLEAAGRLQEAAKAYRQAVELDPLSHEARDALERVSDRLKHAQFTQLIAHGYALLETRQFQDAREAFGAAGKLLPDSKQPAQGLAKVDKAVRDDMIESLKVEAEHFEDQQEWTLAGQSWQQLLTLAPDAAFALEGAARAQLRATLLARLEGYIQAPQRLGSVRVANEARALLEDIAVLEGGPGSRILDKVSALKEMLMLANRPVPIALQSDNQTDVTLLRVARLGRFQHHEVLLKPGRYTLIGSRPGYRDVRKTLEVTLGMESGSLSIHCEETI